MRSHMFEFIVISANERGVYRDVSILELYKFGEVKRFK